MAACGSLEHIFKKPLPENPTLLESLSSWKRIKSMNAIDDSSFTEIFGELHFKETPIASSPSSSSSSSSSSFPQSSPSSSLSSNSTDIISPPLLAVDILPKTDDENGRSNLLFQEKSRRSSSSNGSYYHPPSHKKQYRSSDSFSSMNSESLSLCTEGLGFESSDDVEDIFTNSICSNEWKYLEERRSFARNVWGESKRSRTNRGDFPPPISCIGRSGKPWVCFKSYREDGRFILKEIRIPTQEFLHACREDGRLKLQFIQSDDEAFEEEEDEEDEESLEEKNQDTCDENRENNVETSYGNGNVQGDQIT